MDLHTKAAGEVVVMILGATSLVWLALGVYGLITWRRGPKVATIVAFLGAIVASMFTYQIGLEVWP